MKVAKANSLFSTQMYRLNKILMCKVTAMAEVRTKKSKKFTVKMQKKLLLVFLFVIAFLIGLSIVLIKIHLNKGEDYSKAVYDNFSYSSRVIPARRGEIRDRNGIVLAYSTKVYNLILDTKVMLSDEAYKEPTIEAIVKHFKVEEKELRAYIEENEAKKESGNSPSSYKRFISTLMETEIEEFVKEMEKEDSKIKGVWFEEEYKRIYPYNTVACDTIGFASEANGGELGIESFYEAYLAGTDGRKYGYIDNSAYETTIIDPVNGNNIVSTLDVHVQNIIEDEIRIFNEAFGSASSSVVVMDPNSGEVLGMCDYPTFDLNNPRDLSHVFSEEDLLGMTDEERVEALFSVWSNSTISYMYEPGSVFKSFVVSAALEEGIAKREDTFECDGHAMYGTTKITCNGEEPQGLMSLGETLAFSCNDALMQIGDKQGVDMFCKYVNMFRFGLKTGIDLPSESEGIVIKQGLMTDIDLATNSFGQNINVTMVQTAAAFASLINGGNYYEPHVVKGITDSSGSIVKEYEPVLVTKTVTEKNSKEIRSYLRGVVDYGTGLFVTRKGYSIGGKTGTAEKQPRDDENYVISFMAFAPAEDPKFLLYVVIDSPETSIYANSIPVQIVTANIMDRLMPYFGVKPDYSEYEVPYVHVGTDPAKKNGEILITSDGYFKGTDRQYLTKRDREKEEAEKEQEEQENQENETTDTNVE